jgi:acetate kinase
VRRPASPRLPATSTCSAGSAAPNEDIISTAEERVSVRVMLKDEELMIAKSVIRVVGIDPNGIAET